MVGDGTYLSVNEVMALTGDSESTVWRLYDDGVLDGFLTYRGGHRRIRASSVLELLRRRHEAEDAADPASDADPEI